ncbi:hypothetical protein [Microbacterium testaceum]|uniref:hypothetical protein n=1 Tax=Microbacterium testaceum TaxID=2033 RepID=UPI002AC68738|nr:hypothetical protein [Microbacterium testaceum]MDZ5145336.1 hypothetical protein [Microbacterium testaceum]
MSVRHDFAETLSDEWAAIPALADVRVVATERELDELDRITVLIRMRSVGKHAAAPLSHRQVGLLVTLISPSLDLDVAADELDEVLAAALDYFDSRFLYEDATTVGYADRLAFDIPVTLIAAKE